MKKYLLFSICLNIYLLSVLFYNGLVYLGGGRVLSFPEKNNIGIGFTSMKDWLGLNKHYKLRFHKGSDRLFSKTEDYIILKTPKILSWTNLRGNAEVLKYDDDTNEIILKISGYIIKISSEWMDNEMVIHTVNPEK